jgi:hypothetical protein
MVGTIGEAQPDGGGGQTPFGPATPPLPYLSRQRP